MEKGCQLPKLCQTNVVRNIQYYLDNHKVLLWNEQRHNVRYADMVLKSEKYIL